MTAIPAASVLKFLYLANELDLNPRIERSGEYFRIRYNYPDRYCNELVAIDQNCSESLSDYSHRCFHSELKYLEDRYEKKQADSEEKERQDLLNRLTDREKELLGIS